MAKQFEGKVYQSVVSEGTAIFQRCPICEKGFTKGENAVEVVSNFSTFFHPECYLKAKPLAISPKNAGKPSTAEAVGRQLADIFNAIERVHINAYGPVINELGDLMSSVIDRLREDGWRVTVNPKDKWQVLKPPSGHEFWKRD